MSKDSSVTNSVLVNSKKAAKNVSVYVRKNKQKDNTSANVISNKENVIDVDVANASKVKTLLCVSCMQNVLIPCHDKCLAKHKLNVRSNVRRTFSTNSRTPKSLETTYVAPKTRFCKKETQYKTLDTTYVVSKSKIDVESASKAKDKVSSASRIKKTNLRDKPLSTFIKNKIRTSRIWQKWFESQPNVILTPVNIKPNVANTCSSEKPLIPIKKWVVKLPSCPCVVSSCDAGKHMMGDRLLLRNFMEKFMGTVRFRNDNFAAITGYGDYIHGNITIFHVYYVEGGRDSNLYTISISDMVSSPPVCLVSKATSTKSWLWHRRLSHLNFGTINDLNRLDLVDGLPKFKYEKDHLCSACERGKSKKASHPSKLVPSDHSKLELLHMDLCGPMRVALISGKKYILVIVTNFSKFIRGFSFFRSKDDTFRNHHGNAHYSASIELQSQMDEVRRESVKGECWEGSSFRGDVMLMGRGASRAEEAGVMEFLDGGWIWMRWRGVDVDCERTRGLGGAERAVWGWFSSFVTKFVCDWGWMLWGYG
ncbi:integrase, catalytic region, zinc finger, CCHC-type containing protein [Tanacetum coccineum]